MVNELIEKVKSDQRITHNALNDNFKSDIEACKTDLELAGVLFIYEKDPLLEKAIKLYCRWQNNFENAADRYEKAYEKLKNALALSGDYNGRWYQNV